MPTNGAGQRFSYERFFREQGYGAPKGTRRSAAELQPFSFAEAVRRGFETPDQRRQRLAEERITSLEGRVAEFEADAVRDGDAGEIGFR